jgi:hypothetical protein
LPNGGLTGNFTVDTGGTVEVDHFIGANMSFRRAALAEVGGIHDYYPGTCLREETDPALRVRIAGWRLLFQPTAVVDHVSGTYAKGRRFDIRYSYYAQRNHLVLIAAVVGLRSPQFRGSIIIGLEVTAGHLARIFSPRHNPHGAGVAGFLRRASGALGHACGTFLGLGVGLAQALRLRHEASGRTWLENH